MLAATNENYAELRSSHSTYSLSLSVMFQIPPHLYMLLTYVVCQYLCNVMISTTKGETSQPLGENCNISTSGALILHGPEGRWLWTCLLRRLDLVRVDSKVESWMWHRCARLLLCYQRVGGKTGQGRTKLILNLRDKHGTGLLPIYTKGT